MQAASLRRARSDLKRLFTQSHIWRALAFADIRSKYRLSQLGTLWISFSTGITAVIIGGVYGGIFGIEINKYLPYFVVGMVIWTWITSSLNEATSAMLSASSLIKASNLPIAFHVMRVIQRNFIVLLHNTLIVLLVWLWFRWSIDFSIFLSVIGLALVYIFSVGVALVVSMACVRYRDIPPMIAAGTQFLFFVTPILWYPEQLKVGNFVLSLNPIYYLITVTRDPILGRPVSIEMWFIAAVIAFGALAVGLANYVRYRDRVAYWV